MKLITAVIGKKDLNPVCDALREAGYSFTKIPTSGGFLRSSNMTLLIGVDDDKLAHAVELINQNCRKIMLDTVSDHFLESRAVICSATNAAINIFVYNMVVMFLSIAVANFELPLD